MGDALVGTPEELRTPTLDGVPTPGVRVSRPDGGKTRSCSLGWPVYRSGSGVGFLTAGHCGDIGGASWYTRAPSGAVMLGPFVDRENKDTFDAALTFLSPGVAWSKSIRSSINVRGFLSAQSVMSLKEGTPVCMAAAVGLLRCGTLTSAGKTVMRMNIEAFSGDSGGAVFVHDSAGNAWAIGILHGTTPGTSVNGHEDNRATLLEPIMQQWGLTFAG